VLFRSVPLGPRPGLPPRRTRARRADRSAPARPPRQPRGQRSRGKKGRVITLWELQGQGGRRYSMFSWRTRMALKHKRLDFTTQPVRLADKAMIAFSGGKTVPILRDG